jgi:hypothetical protein
MSIQPKPKNMKFHYLSPSPYQMIDCTLLDLKVNYHVHNTPLFVHVLSQINLIHALSCYFLKIHLNIILPPMTTSSMQSSSFVFPLRTVLIQAENKGPKIHVH